MKLSITLPLLSIFACFACSNTPKQHDFEILAGAPNHCYFNEMLLSPDGKAIALFSSSIDTLKPRRYNTPNSFLVLHDETEDTSKPWKLKPRPDTFHAFGNIRPIRWDGKKLHSRVHKGTIVTTRLEKKNWIINYQSIPREWQQFKLKSHASGTMDFLADKKYNKIAKDMAWNREYIRMIAHISKELQFSSVSFAKQLALNIHGDNNIRSIIGASLYRDFNILPHNGKMLISSLGDVPKELFSKEVREQIYSRLIFNHENGQVLGAYTPDSIFDFDNKQNYFSDEIDKRYPNIKSFISHVAYANNMQFILLNLGESYRLMIFSTDNKSLIADHLVCESRSTEEMLKLFQQAKDAQAKKQGKKPIIKTRAPDKKKNIKFSKKVKSNVQPKYGIKFSNYSNARGNLYRPNEKPSDDLIIYLHGGPAANLYKHTISQILEHQLIAGKDVISVEYSGSTGAGLDLSLGLREKGQKALFDDAKALKEWIKSQGYKSAKVYSESFGAIPALVMLQEYRETFKKGVFLIPALTLVEENQIAKAGGKLFKSSATGQVQFEEQIYGGTKGRKNFKSWLTQYTQNFKATSDDVFIFGELDKIAPVSALPKTIADVATITIIPKTGHMFISAEPEVHEKISEALNTP